MSSYITAETNSNRCVDVDDAETKTEKKNCQEVKQNMEGMRYFIPYFSE